MGMFFFFNDTATTEIYTLSLHDALPICRSHAQQQREIRARAAIPVRDRRDHHEHQHERPDGRRQAPRAERSEEHTSELQLRQYLVCRLLLEKKKKIPTSRHLTDHSTYLS